ncbi:MAG: trigger factor [Bacillota bacterium]|nr:MAG: trigger factor [Bacillota bacterium]
MKATLEKVEDRRATLTVEVDAETVAKAVDQAYRRLVRRVQIPGFRKGRAPRFLVERHLGKAALYEEALDRLLPEAYSQAVAQTGIEPIDRPKLTVESFDEETGLRFTAEVEVKPEVDLGDYRSLRLEPPAVEVTAEQVDEELRRLQEMHATLVPADDAPAEKGMTAVIDFSGTMDGRPVPNGQAENYSVELGAGRLLEDVEAQLLGMRPGEEKDVEVTFPDDFGDEALRGKKATFHIRLKELKRKQLPELDDEFAREAAGADSLQDLRQRIEKELTEIASQRARSQFRNQVVERVVEQARVEVPDTLVNRRIDQLVEQLEDQLRRQGTDLERFLQQTGQTREGLREQFRERAVAEVRADLVLDAVGKKEGIEAEPAEVEAEVRAIAAAYGQPYERLRRVFAQTGYLLEIADAVRRRKIIDRLVAIARGDAPEAETGPQAGDGAGSAASGTEEPAAAPGEAPGSGATPGSDGAEPGASTGGAQ